VRRGNFNTTDCIGSHNSMIKGNCLENDVKGIDCGKIYCNAYT
jgi:hypothetical protein